MTPDGADAAEHLKAPTGPLMAGTVMVLTAAAAVLVVIDEGPGMILSVWPWLGLVAGLAWAVYWRPEVAVSDGGVRLVNVWRTIDVPWPALRAIETKWALTLETVWGTYRAWAAPAPGRGALRQQWRNQRDPARAIDRRVPGLPAGHYGRPSDMVHTDSGAAAQVVNERWKRLREAGHLDGELAGVVEQGRPPVRWHWETFAAGGVLVALGLVGLALA